MAQMLDRSSEDLIDPDHDALSSVLGELRLSAVSYGHCRFLRPWGVHIPAEAAARLHVVVAGECWLRVPKEDPIRLGVGDAAFLPTGVDHSMAHTARGPTRPLAEFPRERIGERTFTMTVGGGGAETLMACCAVRFDQPTLHPLLNLMPTVVLVRRSALEDATLRSLLDGMAGEVMTSRIGKATILARLADVAIARLIRDWAENQDSPTGWLAALRDKNIGRALTVIHNEPGHHLSIAELAARAALSRSVFCERFAELTGQTPARYVAHWRMQLATRWLKAESLSIAEVAGRLGYGSEAAFSRAFKRVVGHAPSGSRQPKSDPGDDFLPQGDAPTSALNSFG